jgi:hypothetical protein
VHVGAELDTGLTRWLWLVKWLLAIPQFIVLAFLWLGQHAQRLDRRPGAVIPPAPKGAVVGTFDPGQRRFGPAVVRPPERR